MIRPIMRDMMFLSQPSERATPADRPVMTDLLDTLNAHLEDCVGMAANMIGVCKRIIAIEDQGKYTVMYNPEILRQNDPYEAEEGCLSLTGTRKTRRYRSIKLKYQNEKFQTRIKNFSGFTAQIIQHEIDHCNGIII